MFVMVVLNKEKSRGQKFQFVQYLPCLSIEESVIYLVFPSGLSMSLLISWLTKEKRKRKRYCIEIEGLLENDAK